MECLEARFFKWDVNSFASITSPKPIYTDEEKKNLPHVAPETIVHVPRNGYWDIPAIIGVPSTPLDQNETKSKDHEEFEHLVKKSQLSVDCFTLGMIKLLLECIKDRVNSGNTPFSSDRLKYYEDSIAALESSLTKQACEQVNTRTLTPQDWYHIFTNRSVQMIETLINNTLGAVETADVDVGLLAVIRHRILAEMQIRYGKTVLKRMLSPEIRNKITD